MSQYRDGVLGPAPTIHVLDALKWAEAPRH